MLSEKTSREVMLAAVGVASKALGGSRSEKTVVRAATRIFEEVAQTAESIDISDKSLRDLAVCALQTVKQSVRRGDKPESLARRAKDAFSDLVRTAADGELRARAATRYNMRPIGDGRTFEEFLPPVLRPVKPKTNVRTIKPRGSK